MKNFALYQPTTMTELLELVEQEGSYHLLAGGTDLLVRWKRGMNQPERVVNLKSVQELDYVCEKDGGLEIGALVKVNQLPSLNIVQRQYPALAQAAALHSSPLIRNLATVVGNICNASPAADLTPALLVYGAKVKITHKGGERLVELKDFFVGPGKTVLRHAEVVQAIILPATSETTRSYFLKEGKRKAHEIAVVNCAVSYREEAGKVTDLKVALGAVAPTPLLLDSLEWFKTINEANLAKICEMVGESVKPITDQRSTDWYRREVVQVLVKRAIIAAQSN